MSEAIKSRTGKWRRHLENYRLSLGRLGAAGIRVVVYIFMPVIDWVRTDLRHRLPDGSDALRSDLVKWAAVDLCAFVRPGAGRDYTPAQREEAEAFWASLDPAGCEAFPRPTLDLFPEVRLGLTLVDFRTRLAPYAAINAGRQRGLMRPIAVSRRTPRSRPFSRRWALIEPRRDRLPSVRPGRISPS